MGLYTHLSRPTRTVPQKVCSNCKFGYLKLIPSSGTYYTYSEQVSFLNSFSDWRDFFSLKTVVLWKPDFTLRRDREFGTLVSRLKLYGQKYQQIRLRNFSQLERVCMCVGSPKQRDLLGDIRRDPVLGVIYEPCVTVVYVFFFDSKYLQFSQNRVVLQTLLTSLKLSSDTCDYSSPVDSIPVFVSAYNRKDKGKEGIEGVTQRTKSFLRGTHQKKKIVYKFDYVSVSCRTRHRVSSYYYRFRILYLPGDC